MRVVVCDAFFGQKKGTQHIQKVTFLFYMQKTPQTHGPAFPDALNDSTKRQSGILELCDPDALFLVVFLRVTHSRATNVGNFRLPAKTRKWYGQNDVAGDSDVLSSIPRPRTARGRDGGAIGMEPAFVHATRCLRTDVSSEVLTLVRLADCMRWNSWDRVPQTPLGVRQL